jgi:hypothetical protein
MDRPDLGNKVAIFISRSAVSQTGNSILRRLAPSAILAGALLPISAVAAYAVGKTPGEYPLFGPAGANLLLGNWNKVFANAKLQAGPFEIAPYGIARLLALHTAAQWFLFYLCMLYVLMFVLSLVLLLPIGRVSGRLGLYVPVLVLAIAIIGAFLPTALMRGHLAEVMIPLLWIVAGCLSRERMFAAAGVAIAFSAGFEVWGVLGVPLIFLAPSPRILRAAVSVVITLLVVYLPFVLTGTFKMFNFQWNISLGTVYRAIWPHLATFPWTLRALQAVFALTAGWGVALLTRRYVYGIWLVPLAVLSVRLLLDPLLFFYYWMGPATVALCALAATLYLRKWIPAVVAAGVVGWLWLPPQAPFLTAVSMVLLVALAVLALRISGRRGFGPPGVPRGKRGVIGREDAPTSPH